MKPIRKRTRFQTACCLGLALAASAMCRAQQPDAPAAATPTTTRIPTFHLIENPLPASLTGVHRIVCLGDSITQGGEGPGGYVWLVRHYLADLYPQQNITVINAGISGHKSSDMLARFQRDVLDRSPDMLTISVGVNDVWHAFRDFAHNQDHPDGDLPNGVPLDAFRRNVDDMVTQAQKANIRVVMLSPTLIYEDLSSVENARLALYSDALRDIARQHKCSFVDYQKPMKALVRDYRALTGASDNLLTVDGVHMNASGNRCMAHVLLSGLGVTPQDRASVQKTVESEQRANKTP